MKRSVPAPLVRRFVALALLALVLLSLPTSVLAEERDDSGIAVLLPADDGGVVAALDAALSISGRFHFLPTPDIKLPLKPPLFVMDPPATPTQRDQWLKKTAAHWLLTGAIATHSISMASPRKGKAPATGTSYDLQLRVFDLVLGDIGPLFTGSGLSPAEVAAEAVRFLRVHYPLHATVAALHEDTVFLDVGHEDGIGEGSVFFIVRHPGTMNEPIGTVQVMNAGDWYSSCEVIDSVKNRNPQVGDVAIEDTSLFLTPSGQPAASPPYQSSVN